MTSLKSTFSNLKTSATAALDNLESKLADPVVPNSQGQQTQQPRTPVDPAEAESVMWTVPRFENSKVSVLLLDVLYAVKFNNRAFSLESLTIEYSVKRLCLRRFCRLFHV